MDRIYCYKIQITGTKLTLISSNLSISNPNIEQQRQFLSPKGNNTNDRLRNTPLVGGLINYVHKK